MTVAREYFHRILSPWAEGVDNPVPKWVDRVASSLSPADATLAVDVGCGPGILTCYLAQRFDRVVAIDRDPTMVDAATELIETVAARAARQGGSFAEVEVRRADWLSCDDLGRADLVCMINSVLEVDSHRRRLMLELARKALEQRKGTMVGVFPAMEAQIHLLRLYVADLEGQGLDQAQVDAYVNDELLVAHSFDALAGTFASRDERAQKFFYELELGWELARAGLGLTELGRVHYPWQVCQQVDAGYFPGEVELWDWFVVAETAANVALPGPA